MLTDKSGIIKAFATTRAVNQNKTCDTNPTKSDMEGNEVMRTAKLPVYFPTSSSSVFALCSPCLRTGDVTREGWLFTDEI